MVKGKNIHLMEVPNFGLSKVGSGEEMHIPGEGISLPYVNKNRQQEPIPNGNISSRQGDNKTNPLNSMKVTHIEQVRVEFGEAPTRAKTLSGRGYSYVGVAYTPKLGTRKNCKL